VMYKGYGRLENEILRQYDVIIPETLNRRGFVNLMLEEEPN